MDKNTSRI